MTSAIPVQCSTNWAIKLTGSWSLCKFVIYPYRRWRMQVNIWKFIYLNCGEWWESMIDHRSYAHNVSSCEINAWKKFQNCLSRVHKLRWSIILSYIASVCNRYNMRSDWLVLGHYLALTNRAGGLYGRILTEVVSTDRTLWGLCTLPRSRFSHTDQLSSVNKMFIIWQTRTV